VYSPKRARGLVEHPRLDVGAAVKKLCGPVCALCSALVSIVSQPSQCLRTSSAASRRWRPAKWLSTWLSLERCRYLVELGETHEIAAAIGKETTAPLFLSMHLVLNALRANAAAAGITLPLPLTVNPNDEQAYSKWRDEIRSYQEAADARLARKRLNPA